MQIISFLYLLAMSENMLQCGSVSPCTEYPGNLLRMVMFWLSNTVMLSIFSSTFSSSSCIYSIFFLPIRCCSMSFPFRIINLSPYSMRQLFSFTTDPSDFNTKISWARRYFCAEIHPIEVFLRQRSSLCPTSQLSRGQVSQLSSLGFLSVKKKSCFVSSLRQSNIKIIIIIHMQADKVIRSALHAGSWYTNNKGKLLQELETNLSKAEKSPQLATKKIKAIIGPHAGYRYSGPVAAWCYKYLTAQPPKKLRVFLLGPSHYKFLDGVSFSICTQLQTPIGNIEVDLQTIKTLRGEIEEKTFSKKEEQKQHSLEMHLPFLRQVLGDNFKIVPIIVGSVNEKKADALGEKLAKYFDDKDTIFVVSSDFCHWGDHFDYQPHDEQRQIHEYIKELDHMGMGLIEKHDIKGFTKYLDETGNTICGQNPIKVLLSTILHSKLKLGTKFVQYDQSEKVKTVDQSSVSYAASVTYQIQ